MQEKCQKKAQGNLAEHRDGYDQEVVSQGVEKHFVAEYFYIVLQADERRLPVPSKRGEAQRQAVGNRKYND